MVGVKDTSRATRHLLYERGIKLNLTGMYGNIESTVREMKIYKKWLEEKEELFKLTYLKAKQVRVINLFKKELYDLIGLGNIKRHEYFSIKEVKVNHIKFKTDSKTIDVFLKETSVNIVDFISKDYNNDVTKPTLEMIVLKLLV